MSEQLRLLHRDLGHHALNDLTDASVEILAIPRRDGVVDELAQQRLPEAVIAMARELDEAACAEARERGIDVDVLAEERPGQPRLAGARRDSRRVGTALFRSRGKLPPAVSELWQRIPNAAQ